MDSQRELLTAGIAAAKGGRAAEARWRLREVLRRDADNVAAWVWLSQVAHNSGERRRCIEQVIAIAPDHPAAVAGQAWLAQHSLPDVAAEASSSEAASPEAASSDITPLDAASAEATPSNVAPFRYPASSDDVPFVPSDGQRPIRPSDLYISPDEAPPSVTPPVDSRWMEVTRVTLGLWAAPLMAAWVNARFVIGDINLEMWAALLVAGWGSYLWVSATDLPRNPGMCFLFGDDGLDTAFLRTLFSLSGAILWLMGFGLILVKV